MSSLRGAFLLLLLTTIVLSSSSAIAAAEETSEEPLDYPDTIIDNAQEESSSSSSSTTTDSLADIHPGKKKNSRQAVEQERNLEHDYWWPTYSPTEVCLFDIITFRCTPFVTLFTHDVAYYAQQ